MTRDHDLVLVGATGFVGRLTASYLAENAPAGLRIAIAGRNHDTLEELRWSLPEVAEGWSVIVADAHDTEAMQRLAASTRVVATAVGPYLKHGHVLARSCAEAGTDYVDLTGELLFVRDSIDLNHEVARRSGARIVHACGFDSVPSDLGVQALAAQGAPLGRTTLTVTSLRGGISGGTIDSLRTQVAMLRAEPALARIMGDPYALSPDRGQEPSGRNSTPNVSHEPDRGGWLAPFIMGPFNARIVRRSNALTHWSYGRDFRYSESVACGNGPMGAARATAMAAAQGAFISAMRLPPAEALISRFLPEPGEGPGPDSMERGRFRLRIHTESADGRRLVGRVGLDLDPGYRGTAVMFGESALCLALDVDRTSTAAEGGVLTPAVAMRDALAQRLRAAGMTLDVHAED